jgi:Tol biopolymer transport system component
MRTDGSQEMQAVNTLGRNVKPLWSPDGKRLLFLSNRSGKNGLWSIGIVDGKTVGDASEVIPDLGDGLVTPLGVTPAGVYEYVFQQDGVEQIVIIPMDKSGRKQPGAEEHLVGTRPIWSPDGKYMLFTRRQPGFDRGQQRGAPHFAVVRNMISGEERTFPASLGELQLTDSWFSDGRGILTRVTRNGVKGLYRLNVETFELTAFVEGLVFDDNTPVILSRDEKTLYFFRGEFRSRNLTTGAETSLLSAADGRLVPVLSPDGAKWAISKRVPGERRRYFGIADTSGGNVRELYSPPFDMLFEHVNWAPDMKTIFFHQARPEDKDRITPLSTFFPNDIWPRQVMRLSVDGGPPEYTGIEADGWMLGALAISPDGRRGAYSYVKPVSELRTIRLAALK